MKIEVEAKVLAPGESVFGNTEPKLVPAGGVWEKSFGSEGTTFCIHGEKLRWSCDDCREYFNGRHPNAP
jgi:hypothetical protein